MIRKIALLAVGAVAVLGLLTYAGLGSYTATAWSKLRAKAKNQVPIEFEIDRLKHEVAELVPDMNKKLTGIAEEMVAVQNLKEEIAVTQVNLQTQKDNLQTMTKDLDSGAESITYDGRDYSRARVSEKLARDFDSFKHCQEELKSKEQLLDARERALDAAREQLGSIRSQKQDLEVQIAQLEAELKSVRLAQTRNKFEFDDSRLADCKKSLTEIRNRLKVEATTAELEGQFANDPIPVDKKAKPVSDLTKEVEAYLDGKPAGETKVASGK